MLGSIVDAVLVRGLLLFEQLTPLPARLGVPLPPQQQARRDADPVVLVGGFANTASGWNEWRRSLEADGFQVFVFDPPTAGLGDMRDSAAAVAAYIEHVRQLTGRQRVDVIGFSEGGVLARMAVTRHGLLGAIDRIISLATPHAGIELGGVQAALTGVRVLRRATPEALLQLLIGSSLLHEVERADAALRLGGRRVDARAPRYASIFSRTHDMVVAPASSWLAGAFNIPVQADTPGTADPNHYTMFHLSDRAYEAARILLLDGPEPAAAAAGLDSLSRASRLGRS